MLRIAVNTRLLIPDKLEGVGRFSVELLRRLVQNHPEVEFVFCFDRPFSPEFIFGPNVKGLVVNPPARHPFLYYYWFQHRLPKALETENIDLFFSPDGHVPLKLKAKTLVAIHDLAFEHFAKGVDVLHQLYYKFFFLRFARKATRLITVSDFSKADLVRTYQVNPEKIDVIHNGVSAVFKQSEIKLADRIPYFIYVGAIHPRKNILNLLRAFEQFKTANAGLPHQMVLVSRSSWKTSQIARYLKKMIHRTDVIFNKNLSDNELNILLNNATALVYPSYFEGFGLPVIEAFACGTPVITTKNTVMAEIAKGAAHLFEANNVDELAELLFLQASGAAQNAEKIKLGLTLVQNYSWDIAAEQLWQTIQKTLA
ncbi:glycosyltransferase family 4 protein [Pelobium manganitolerans]|uniref:glycosyltransferase family 4 protein n=1 Tax=Pelobium manganitolerans TaxID=1842495 RepID=UPI000E73162B|nr:glycosyltransferase family 1 protein [Pelobium manganitolerans]